MLRDLLVLLAVLGLSGGAAVTTNLAWHKLPWLREPAPVVSSNVAISTTGSGTTSLATELTPEILVEHLQNGLTRFVDAREEYEFAKGHLLGAINLPASAVYASIDRALAVISPNDKVIVYCGGKTCDASKTVSDVLLREYGYRDVVVYEPGWEVIGTSPLFKDFLTVGE